MTDTPIIGQLNEQTLHLALKNYIDPDPSHHEVKYLGAVADILNDDGITEIETSSFVRLGKKLGRFLGEKKVTVVYPVAEKTTVVLIDGEGNEVRRYRSPKKCSARDIFHLIYKLPAECLSSDRLFFRFVYLDVLQYRKVRGTRGKRTYSEKVNRIPEKINRSEIFRASDFTDFFVFPGNEFTAKEFSAANGLQTMRAWEVLKYFENTGFLGCSREKKAFVYFLTGKT